MHFMQICLTITPTYIPQVNKYSFRMIYSVGPVGFLMAAQFAILVQRFSNVSHLHEMHMHFFVYNFIQKKQNSQKIIIVRSSIGSQEP
jgi:hypothetical protein